MPLPPPPTGHVLPPYELLTKVQMELCFGVALLSSLSDADAAVRYEALVGIGRLVALPHHARAWHTVGRAHLSRRMQKYVVAAMPSGSACDDDDIVSCCCVGRASAAKASPHPKKGSGVTAEAMSMVLSQMGFMDEGTTVTLFVFVRMGWFTGCTYRVRDVMAGSVRSSWQEQAERSTCSP